MKKLLIFVSFIFISLFAFTSKTLKTNAFSISDNEGLVLISENTTYYFDGSYIETRVYSNDTNVYSKSASSSSHNYGDEFVKGGVCEVTRYNGDGSIIWQFFLGGQFQVVYGVSCVCFYATYTQYSNSSLWTFSNGGTRYSDNAAYGYGTFKYKALLITLQTVNIDVRVMCDEYGNII